MAADLSTSESPGEAFWLREISYVPLDEHAWHCHETCSVTLILSGALEEGSRFGTHPYGAFSVVTKPAGVYHKDRFGPRGARTFQLAFTAEQAHEYCPGLTYRWQRGGPIARAMLALFQRSGAGRPENPVDYENGAIDVLTCVTDHSQPSKDQSDLAPMAQLAEYLDAEAPEGVSVRKLANELRMHPVSLARAFRRYYGCSITEFIRRRRIANACELMDAETLPLVHVSVQAGFADQPHFTRAFKTETGLTPAAYRVLACSPRRGSNRSRQPENARVL